MAVSKRALVLDVTPPPTSLDRAWQRAYWAAYPIMRLWWRWRRKDHHGALIAVQVAGRLLLVRSSYKSAWSFPGGGVEAGETSSQAAERELREEIGVQLAISGQPVVVFGHWEGRRDTVHVYEVELDTLPPLRLDNREVVGARLVGERELATMALSGPVRGYLDARRTLNRAPENEHARP